MADIFYCLKKGDFEYVLSDVKEYLCIPLQPNNLSASDLHSYSDYAYKFLHVYVYKLDEVPRLEETLDVLSDCYKVAKLSPTSKTGKDALFVENLLYHLIVKLLKKNLLEAACRFSLLVSDTLTVLLSRDEHARNLAHILYVPLWNAAIIANKEDSSPSSTESIIQLSCRVAALRLLTLSVTDTNLIVDRTCIAVMKAKNAIAANRNTDRKVFCLVTQMVNNTLKALLVSDSDESKGIVKVILAHVQTLMHCDAFDEAKHVCKNIGSTLDMKQCGFSKIFKVIEAILLVGVESYQLKGTLGRKDRMNNLTEFIKRFSDCATILNSASKLGGDVSRIYSIIHVMEFTSDVLHQTVQEISYLKLDSASSCSFIKSALQVAEAMIAAIHSLLGNTKSESLQFEMSFHCLVVTIRTLHLRIYYYFLVLFIQDKEVTELNTKNTAYIKSLSVLLEQLDKSEYNLEFHVAFVEVTFKIGRLFYLNRQFKDAIPCLTAMAEQFNNIMTKNGKLTENLQNGRHHTILADCFRHLKQNELAMEAVVQGIHVDPTCLDDLVAYWVKVKYDMQESKPTPKLIMRTLDECCRDPAFVKFLPQPVNNTSSLSTKTLLQAELNALKELSYPVCAAQLTVIKALAQLSSDKVEQAQLMIERAHILWLTHEDKHGSYSLCGEAEAIFNKALTQRKSVSSHPTLEDQLAAAKLWTYILNDVDPIKVLQELQEKKDKAPPTEDETTSNSRPATPTDDNINETETFTDCVTVTMETHLLKPVDLALDLWESLIGSNGMEKRFGNMKQTSELLLIVAAIYKLARKHTQQWRALVACLTLGHACKNDMLCLQVRGHIVALLNELCQPHLAEELVIDTDAWIHSCKRDKLTNGVVYAEYLIIKADTMLLLGKRSESEKMLRDALDLKQKQLKPRSRDAMIIDAGLHTTQCCIIDASINLPSQINADTQATSAPAECFVAPGDTKNEMLHQAIRNINTVVCSLMGNWMINSQMSVCEQTPDNTLDKWLLLDRLLTTTYKAAIYAMELGESRQALCLLTVGTRLCKAFLLPTRLAEFHLAFASLDTLRGKHSDCQAHLHVVSYILDSDKDTRGQQQDKFTNNDAEESMDFEIKSRPMNENDDKENGSDSENLDLSGCASPRTKKTKLTVPEYWNHENKCLCNQCRDIAQTCVNICKFIILIQMNINEENFHGAQSVLKITSKNLCRLTSKSHHVLWHLATDIHKIVSITSMDSRAKKSDENNQKRRIQPSVFQELIVDTCLQACTLSIEFHNDAVFNKWQDKCAELCDTEKYPWMFSKQMVLAELHYLGIVRYLDNDLNNSPTSYDIDQLSSLMSALAVKAQNPAECHTPKACEIAARFRKLSNKDRTKNSSSTSDANSTHLLKDSKLKSTPLASEIEQLDGHKNNVTFDVDTQSDKSPSASPDLLNAPVKAKRGGGSRLTSRTAARSTKSKGTGLSLSSPSVLDRTKTPARKATRVSACSAMPVTVYEEPMPATPMKTPLKTPGITLPSMIQSAVGVCSNRRALLDMLIYSDDDSPKSPKIYEHLKPIKIKGSKSALRVPVTGKQTRVVKSALGEDSTPDKKRFFGRKSKSAKPSTITEKNESITSKIASPSRALFPKDTTTKQNRSSVDIYNFDIADDSPNVTKAKTKKSTRSRKATKSHSPVDESCVSEHSLADKECDDSGSKGKKLVSKVTKRSARSTRSQTTDFEVQRADIDGEKECLSLSNLDMTLPDLDQVNDASDESVLCTDVNGAIDWQSQVTTFHFPLEKYAVIPENCVLPEPDESIEIFRSDPDSNKIETKKSRTRKSCASKTKAGERSTDDIIELSRMSRTRPLQPSTEANKQQTAKPSQLKQQPKLDKVKETNSPRSGYMTPSDALAQLKVVFQSICHNPPMVLYRRICHSLALTLLNSGAPHWEVAYYLTEAQSITFRHKALQCWRARLRKLDKETGDNSADSSTIAAQKLHLEDMRAKLRFDKTVESLEAVVQYLPLSWTVCQISVVSTPGHRQKHLLVTRLGSQREPLVMRMAGFSNVTQTSEILEEYTGVFRQSFTANQCVERAQWWRDRFALDTQVKDLLSKFEGNWLGGWKGVLHGILIHPDDIQRLTECVNKLLTQWAPDTLVADARPKLELLLLASDHLAENELLQGIVDLFTEPRPVAKEICERVQQFQCQAKFMNISSCSRGPVILVLDKDIQHLPWESFPGLETQRMTRMPSVYFISAQYMSSVANENSVFNLGVEPNSAFYVIDPDANLPSTTESFKDWFRKIDGWQGIVQKKPTPEEFKEGIGTNDMFIYCGHGSGSKYLSQGSIEMSECRAATFLLGCSSGKLSAGGSLEASGTMLHYFIAGGPCMLGCLFDITDRDIDRYTEAMLKTLLDTRGQGVLEAAHSGRSACKLRYLTAAAPVVYGLPLKIAEKK